LIAFTRITIAIDIPNCFGRKFLWDSKGVNKVV